MQSLHPVPATFQYKTLTGTTKSELLFNLVFALSGEKRNPWVSLPENCKLFHETELQLFINYTRIPRGLLKGQRH